MRSVAERHERWWLIVMPPLLWAVHFLLSYFTAALWCGKFGGPAASLWPVRAAIVVYTAAALAGIGVAGFLGARQRPHGDIWMAHDADTPEDRHRFVGLTAILLAALSGVAVIYQALPALFIIDCR